MSLPVSVWKWNVPRAHIFVHSAMIIGESLGTGGCMESLKRIRSGRFL